MPPRRDPCRGSRRRGRRSSARRIPGLVGQREPGPAGARFAHRVQQVDGEARLLDVSQRQRRRDTWQRRLNSSWPVLLISESQPNILRALVPAPALSTGLRCVFACCPYWLASAVALVTQLSWGQAAAAQNPGSRTVLAIHWGPEDFPGTSILDAAIREVLLSPPGTSIEYYAEYLESDVLPPATAATALHDYIARKFEGRRIDAVVAITTPALDFALAQREALFPGAPIVFVAGRVPDAVTNRQIPGVTGAAERRRVRRHAGARAEAAPVGAQGARRGAGAERRRLRGAPAGALERFSSARGAHLCPAAVPSRPAGCRHGRAVGQPDSLHAIRPGRRQQQRVHRPGAAPRGGGVPGPGLYDGRCLHGHGRRRRHDARRPGNRTAARRRSRARSSAAFRRSAFPSTTCGRCRRSTGVSCGAGTSACPRCPRDRTFASSPRRCWDVYHRHIIIGSLAVVVVQAVLITGLLTQRARLRLAEQTIRAREATLRTSYDRIQQIAGRLINAQEAARAGVAQDLHDDVCQQLVFVSMGVSTLKNSTGQLQDGEDAGGPGDARGRHSEGVRGASTAVARPASRDAATPRAPGGAAHALCRGGEASRRRGRLHGRSRPPNVHKDVAVCFFRIAQEALRNGIAHGGARRLSVSLAGSGERLDLVVDRRWRGIRRRVRASRRRRAGPGDDERTCPRRRRNRRHREPARQGERRYGSGSRGAAGQDALTDASAQTDAAGSRCGHPETDRPTKGFQGDLALSRLAEALRPGVESAPLVGSGTTASGYTKSMAAL